MVVRRPRAVLWLVLILGLVPAAHRAEAQELVISEFMAANAGGLKDVDGDFSDWIELFNPSLAPVSARDWFLTDNPGDLKRWRLPAVTIPPLGFLVVHASGKDRTNAATELHASFSLDRDGEYLALVRPDGVTVASEFSPSFPSQRTDLSFGRSMTTEVIHLVPVGASGRLLVPGANPFPADWTAPGFDDATWRPVAGAVGYDSPAATSPEPPESVAAADDVTRPTDFIVATSLNSPASEGVGNAIDNQPATKYLNFDKLNAGLTVTTSGGRSLVTGLRLTSANDAPDRDPTTFVLSGSDDGRNFTEIARGRIPDFTARFQPVTVSFANTSAWTHYRLLFPTVRNAAAAVAVQIAEIELLGWIGAPPGDFSSLIATSIESELRGRGTSAVVRLPFELAAAGASGQLVLSIRYEDGFVAWLNGVEVARANVPVMFMAGSRSVTNRLRRDAAVETRFNLTDRLALLRPGRNVLALLGLNARADSREFMIEGWLDLTRVELGALGHLSAPTPGTMNASNTVELLDDVAVQPGHGLQSAPIQVALSCASPGVTLRYTTNGAPPTADTGVVYTAPLSVAGTTVLRAAAFRVGALPSRVVTRTYLFPGDIPSQTRATALAAGFPGTWVSQSADYGLDRRVASPTLTDSYGGKYAKAFVEDLRALPTISLAGRVEDLFGPQGIYANPENHGAAWERPISMEWFGPGDDTGFQKDAGLRIQGGAFRRFDLTLKKSFRIVFRDRYGPSKLRHPLFGPNAGREFDNLVLRANSNDAWPYGGAGAVYVRDAFAMETARALGIPSSHTRFAHLYINGQYWGLYNPVERPDAAFSATYLGGDADTWDSINQDSAPDGNYDAWNRLQSLVNQDLSKPANYQRIQGNDPDGTRNPAYEDLIEIDNYIDYLILNFYLGNTDWPGRNWWAGRDRAGNAGFTFRPWDSETALGVNGVGVDVTGADGAVAGAYARLRANAAFRLRFADHVQRHFSPGGALYVNPASPRWNVAKPGNNQPAARFAALLDAVRHGIVGESARWGDQRGGTPFTRDEHWQRACDDLLANFFPARNPIVLEQFRRAGLLPRTEAPVMNQHGGSVPAGFRLALSSAAGSSIFYTLDGSDPRAPSGAAAGQRYTAPFPPPDFVTLRARTLNGSEWSALTEASFVVGVPDLVLGELHYHPADPDAAERAAGFTNADDFEFIELQNRGTGTTDLAGLRFLSGIQFQFPGTSPLPLAAGGYALLVRNRAAFETRYGTGRPVLGEYAGRFDNSGERVVLVDATGRTLFDFTYGTTTPWPTTPDGTGPSLEVADPSANLSDPGSWIASPASGGSPGAPNPPVPVRLEATVPFPGFVRFQFPVRAGLGYTLQQRASLTSGDWDVLERGPIQSRSGRVETIVNLGTSTRASFFRLSLP